MLIAVAMDAQLALAIAKTIKVCETIRFEGSQFRNDIGLKGVARWVSGKTITRVEIQNLRQLARIEK